MTIESDSANCVDVVFDDRDFPPGPPQPMSAQLREHLRKQRELLRQYGQLPPVGESPDNTTEPPTGPIAS